MPKHVIEDDFRAGEGFTRIKVGDNFIYVSNVDDNTLEILGNGTLDIDVKDNKLRLEANLPVFTKKEW